MRNKNSIRLMIVIPLLVGSLVASAQQINGYRYWFDDDQSGAVEVPVPATTQLHLQTALPVAVLQPGYHSITIQFLDDDGFYSTPFTTKFAQRSHVIDAIEYWFNDGSASATLENVPPATDLDLTTDLNASALPVGMHKVTIRMRDAIGEWSVPITHSFTRSGGMVAGYEYWIDDQVQDRITNAITPVALAQLVADLPIPTTEGEHLFTIRFHDQNEGWSVPLTTTFSFITSIAELPGITDMILFPNPAADNVGIRLNSDHDHELRIELLDATGRSILQDGPWRVNGIAHRTWDTSGLSAGSYFLKIADGDRSTIIPFVKGR